LFLRVNEKWIRKTHYTEGMSATFPNLYNHMPNAYKSERIEGNHTWETILFVKQCNRSLSIPPSKNDMALSKKCKKSDMCSHSVDNDQKRTSRNRNEGRRGVELVTGITIWVNFGFQVVVVLESLQTVYNAGCRDEKVWIMFY
jgi:hypothetical protein